MRASKLRWRTERRPVSTSSRALETLKLEAEIETQIRAQEKTVIFHVKGENLGVLIGKRGQTLDALQYLVSHVVNKKQEPFLRR